MAIHFVCHMLGGLRDDRLTMTPIGSLLSTQNPLKHGLWVTAQLTLAARRLSSQGCCLCLNASAGLRKSQRLPTAASLQVQPSRAHRGPPGQGHRYPCQDVGRTPWPGIQEKQRRGVSSQVLSGESPDQLRGGTFVRSSCLRISQRLLSGVTTHAEIAYVRL